MPDAFVVKTISCMFLRAFGLLKRVLGYALRCAEKRVGDAGLVVPGETKQSFCVLRSYASSTLLSITTPISSPTRLSIGIHNDHKAVTARLLTDRGICYAQQLVFTSSIAISVGAHPDVKGSPFHLLTCTRIFISLRLMHSNTLCPSSNPSRTACQIAHPTPCTLLSSFVPVHAPLNFITYFIWVISRRRQRPSLGVRWHHKWSRSRFGRRLYCYDR